MASKIKVKIGDAEFEAEGEADDIKAQYAAFMELVKASPGAAQQVPNLPHLNTPKPGAEITGDAERDALLKKVFDLDTPGLVSLKILPRGENASADSMLLLLYGYRKLGTSEQVYAVTLAKAARKSGVVFDRTDRALEPHHALFGRGGFKRSTTYTLNNAGEREAERILLTMV